MALKVKAVERKIKFSKEAEGTYRYVMQPELHIALNQAKVIREAALRSSLCYIGPLADICRYTTIKCAHFFVLTL